MRTCVLHQLLKVTQVMHIDDRVHMDSNNENTYNFSMVVEILLQAALKNMNFKFKILGCFKNVRNTLAAKGGGLL